MSASPQANQGLDDGAPLPAADVPGHTAADSGDAHDSDNDGNAAAAAPAKLSQIERHADENDVKDEQGEPSDDQPEDTGDDPQQDLDPEAHPNDDAGVQEQEQDEDDDKDNVATAARKGEAEDDDDEQDDDDEVSLLAPPLHTPRVRTRG